MSTYSSNHRRLWIIAAALLLYLTLTLAGLDRWPPVSEDEAWTAAAPFKLATEGRYASDLFAGYYGSEAGLYHLNPLYHLMLAGVFKLLGAGVVQMRLLPVLLGLGTLLLVHHIGRTLFGNRAALLAVALLLLLRLAVPEYGTGIPLLDIARTNRPDIAVPFFGLAAFALLLAAERSRRTRLYFLCGLLAALSSLSHLYGAFWLPALIVVVATHHGTSGRGRRAAILMVLGFATAWIPVIVWLALDWERFAGQSSMVAGRFDLLSPSFYLHNLLHEYRRFGALRPFDDSSTTGWFRPGLWSVAIGIPAAILVLVRHKKDRWIVPAITVAIVLFVQAILFALLLSIKFFNYFIALWPLIVLLLGWLGVWLWQHRTEPSWRIGLSMVLTMMIIEGGLSIADQQKQAHRATPYDLFERKIAAELPTGARVLGLNRYWLGLRKYDYRSWLVPILLSDPLSSDTALPLDSALERVSPDIILMDRAMRDYFAEVADTANPRHAHYLGLMRFFAHHSILQKAVVEDETYGGMEILYMSR